jgi:hypothetical protein
VRCLRVARPLLDVGKPSLGLEHLSRGGLGKRGLAEGGLHVCDGGSGRRTVLQRRRGWAGWNFCSGSNVSNVNGDTD